MKMTLEYNDQMNMVCVEAEGIEVRVIDTESQWDRYFIVSSNGIRKSFGNPWSFEDDKEATDTEKWLFKCAYGFFAMKHARLEKQKAENEQNEVEITT
jgi:hypothetical protein